MDNKGGHVLLAQKNIIISAHLYSYDILVTVSITFSFSGKYKTVNFMEKFIMCYGIDFRHIGLTFGDSGDVPLVN